MLCTTTQEFKVITIAWICISAADSRARPARVGSPWPRCPSRCMRPASPARVLRRARPSPSPGNLKSPDAPAPRPSVRSHQSLIMAVRDNFKFRPGRPSLSPFRSPGVQGDGRRSESLQDVARAPAWARAVRLDGQRRRRLGAQPRDFPSSSKPCGERGSIILRYAEPENE